MNRTKKEREESGRGKLDYGSYRFSWKQWIRYTVEAVAVCVGINYLFYKSPVVFLFMFPLPIWYLRERKKQRDDTSKKSPALSV